MERYARHASRCQRVWLAAKMREESVALLRRRHRHHTPYAHNTYVIEMRIEYALPMPQLYCCRYAGYAAAATCWLNTPLRRYAAADSHITLPPATSEHMLRHDYAAATLSPFTRHVLRRFDASPLSLDVITISPYATRPAYNKIPFSHTTRCHRI